MSLLDKLFTAQQGDDAIAALQRIATAFERIATVAETFLPAAPEIPAKPLGPENVGEYGQEPSQEDIEDMRAKFRESGMSDAQIDNKLMSQIFGSEDNND